MKKWQLIVVAIVIAVCVIVIFQQHDTIRQYRQMAYYSLEKLTYPIAEALELHENGVDAERQKKLEQLYVEFTTISDQAGVGLTTEPHIKETYYGFYTDARTNFSVYLDKYVAATTAEEREEAYAALKSTYEAYEMRLKEAKEELLIADDSDI